MSAFLQMSFVFIAKQNSIVFVIYIFISHSSVDEHQVDFPAIMNRESFGCVPESGIPGLYSPLGDTRQWNRWIIWSRLGDAREWYPWVI